MRFVSRGAGDVGYALRTLVRHPSFACAVIATLAVAIGANVAIFSIVNALVFRPFPYPEVERLVQLSSTPRLAVRRLGVSYPDFADWRDRSRSFDAMGLASGRGFVMSRGGGAEVVSGARATASLFRVIALPALVGRTFTDEDDRPGREPVVVLGQALWERWFDADPGVVGRALRLDGRDCVVIGVVPRDFAFPDHAELWVPMGADPAGEDRSARGHTVLARLRPGARADTARDELQRIAVALGREYPASNADIDILVTSLAGSRGPRGLVFALLAALGAGGFVLLIACANVANLLLARLTSRTRELAIRTALGATRFQVVRLLIVEGLVLTVPAGVLGVWVGHAGREALIAMVPSGIPTWMRFDTDWRVACFTLALSVLAALASTLSPGLRAARRPPVEALKESGAAAQGASLRLRSALVVSEIGLTFVLLVGAALMVQTFFNASRLDPGFRPAGLLSFRLPLPAVSDTADRRVAVYERVEARVRMLPGVTDVALTSVLPVAGEGRGAEFEIEGVRGVDRAGPLASRGVVSETYYRTVGLPIVAGRAFDGRDRAGGLRVAIVSRSLAESQWPRGTALGKRLRFVGGGPSSPWLTVVGVAGDTRSWRLEDNSLPWIYVPFAQNTASGMTLLARSRNDPLLLADAVRAEVSRVDPDVPVIDLLPLDALIRRSLWAERMFAATFEVFGAVALGLAVIGVYGVVSYSVARRTREMGIRAALGADDRSLRRLVLRDGARLALVGVLVGAAGAYAASRGMTRLLYGVSGDDARTYAAVSLVLFVTAVGASLVPAWRASRMDPLRALRHE